MKDISLEFIIKSNFKHFQKRPVLFNQLDHNNRHQWQGWFSQHPLLLCWNCEQHQHEALGRKSAGNFFSKPKNFQLPVIAWDLNNDKIGFCLFVSLLCCLTLMQPPPIKTEMYITAMAIMWQIMSELPPMPDQAWLHDSGSYSCQNWTVLSNLQLDRLTLPFQFYVKI